MMQKFISREIEYQVVEFLGEGGCSEVYRVRRRWPDMDVDQELALKILKSETLVDIWRKEFQEFQGLQSPHLLSILGFDNVNGRPALLLEYVHGVSLTELKKHKNLSESIKFELLRQITEGLVHLHQLGKCHGDLSPNNILIDSEGRVVLTDFLGAQSGFGTPAFSAPEVLNGGVPSKETDFYSFHQIARWLSVPNFDVEELLVNAQAQADLALFIRDLLEQKEQRLSYTQPLDKPKKKSAYKAVSLFLSLLLPLLIGSSASSIHRNDYRLEIITEKWAEIIINGKKLGYPPILFSSSTPDIRVQWRNQNAIGEVNLRLRPGEHRRLHDQELFSTSKEGGNP